MKDSLHPNSVSRETVGDGHTPTQIVNNTPIRDPTETEQNGHHLSHVLSSVSVSSLWYMLPKTVTFLYQPFLYLWSHAVDLKSVKIKNTAAAKILF